jgi:hypothetical protein
MKNEIVLSNKAYWAWIKYIIKKNGGRKLDIISKMIDRDNCMTSKVKGEKYPDNFSIFSHLKKVMPREYFHEMEYCALAYSTIFGKILPNLAKNIEQLAYIEWLCYVEPENPHYRDHFVHMLKVAFVYDKIISTNRIIKSKLVKLQFDKSNHFSSWVAQRGLDFDETQRKNIITAAYFLASIFHDFGYGYKFLRSYEERLFKLNILGSDSIGITRARSEIIKKSLLGEFILSRHAECENRPINNLSSKQKDNLIFGFIRDCLPLNHSVASSLIILDIAEDLYQRQIILPSLYIAFQLAAETCLIHDLTNSKNYLHLKNSSIDHEHFLDCNCCNEIPMAILLILADELSMWSRPLIEYEYDNNDIKKINISITNHWKYRNHKVTEYPNKIKIKFIDDSFKIIFENEDQINNFKEILKDCNCFTGKSKNEIKLFDYKIELAVS